MVMLVIHQVLVQALTGTSHRTRVMLILAMSGSLGSARYGWVWLRCCPWL